MKRRFSHIVILVAFLLATLAGIAIAQDEEITLDSLADLVTALTTRVNAIEQKLEPVTTVGGACIQYTSGQIQRETATKYLDTFEENLDADYVTLKAIRYDTEAGVSVYHFEQYFEDQTVTETWRGCEFVGSSDWIQE